jgi:hypothetical protein
MDLNDLAKEPESSNVLKFYELYRDYLKHEDDLTLKRQNGLYIVQAFLIAAYGVVIQKEVDLFERISEIKLPIGSSVIINERNAAKILPQLETVSMFLGGYLLFLCIMGASICLYAIYSLTAGLSAVNNLNDIYRPIALSNELLSKFLPGLTDGARVAIAPDRNRGRTISVSVPFVLCVAWVVMGFIPLFLLFSQIQN